MARQQSPAPLRREVRELRDRPTAQVLVVGGGINGLATFRELALNGVDVALVERSDFASGASAASSHMIHGGIRYLENGELRLVRESVQERNGLLRIAPHFVRPLQTTIPIYSTFSGVLAAPLRLLTHVQRTPKARGALLIKVGLVLYDTFSRAGGTVPRHRFAGRRAALADLPRLDPHIEYTATYFDASVHDPERLALDVLLDGLRGSAASRAANYVEAVGLDDSGVLLLDHETGERFPFRADVVLNASGPWTDLTNEAFGTASQFMGGTKGSHIVLDNPELLAATGGREIFFEHDDGRIVLIYPLKGRVLVGTTDLEADPRQEAVCTDEEVDYFFDLVHHVFPDVPVDRSQIVFRFAGIRPLPRHGDLAPGFVSRDYRIERTDTAGTPVLSLVGGKWTTFRALGETLATQALDILGLAHRVSTVSTAIGGGRSYPAGAEQQRRWVRTHLGALPAERARVLFERYGTRASEVAAHLEEDEDRELAGGRLSVRELDYLVTEERVAHLADVVLRRTDLAFTGDVDARVLDELSVALADVLGWDDDERRADLARTTAELERRFGVRTTTTADARGGIVPTPAD